MKKTPGEKTAAAIHTLSQFLKDAQRLFEVLVDAEVSLLLACAAGEPKGPLPCAQDTLRRLLPKIRAIDPALGVDVSPDGFCHLKVELEKLIAHSFQVTSVGKLDLQKVLMGVTILAAWDSHLPRAIRMASLTYLRNMLDDDLPFVNAIGEVAAILVLIDKRVADLIRIQSNSIRAAAAALLLAEQEAAQRGKLLGVLRELLSERL